MDLRFPAPPEEVRLAPAPVASRTSVTDDQLGELASAEREDVAHHRPARVGDIVFTWFD